MSTTLFVSTSTKYVSHVVQLDQLCFHMMVFKVKEKILSFLPSYLVWKGL